MTSDRGRAACAVLVLTALTLAGCGGSPTPAPTVTVTASSPATTPVTPASSPATDYSGQYLSDIAPWQAAIRAAAGGGLASARARAAGRAAVLAARRMLGQTWPAGARADVHTLAVAFDTLNEDIAADNLSKYESDGTTLNADTNVVRADLGLPSIK